MMVIVHVGFRHRATPCDPHQALPQPLGITPQRTIQRVCPTIRLFCICSTRVGQTTAPHGHVQTPAYACVSFWSWDQYFRGKAFLAYFCSDKLISTKDYTAHGSRSLSLRYVRSQLHLSLLPPLHTHVVPVIRELLSAVETDNIRAGSSD
jgi:hypothetical protein